MRVNSLIVVLALLTTGCMNRFQRVEDYQKRATKACEMHHSPEECKPLPYPSEPE